MAGAWSPWWSIPELMLHLQSFMHRSDPTDPASALPSEYAESDPAELKRRMRACALLAPSNVHNAQLHFQRMQDTHMVHGGQLYRIHHFGEPHTSPGDVSGPSASISPLSQWLQAGVWVGQPGEPRFLSSGAAASAGGDGAHHLSVGRLRNVKVLGADTSMTILLSYGEKLPLEALLQAARSRRLVTPRYTPRGLEIREGAFPAQPTLPPPAHFELLCPPHVPFAFGTPLPLTSALHR